MVLIRGLAFAIDVWVRITPIASAKTASIPGIAFADRLLPTDRCFIAHSRSVSLLEQIVRMHTEQMVSTRTLLLWLKQLFGSEEYRQMPP